MRTQAEVRLEIAGRWADICRRARTRPEAVEALPEVPKLLGTGTKTEAGEGDGYLTAVVYMSPAREAFNPGDARTLCAFATFGEGGCAETCLGHSAGRMTMNSVKLARLWKATLYMGARELWRELLTAEIASFQRSAERAGYVPCVRIDGSTDTGEGERMAPRFPGVRFYDYTKSPHRALKHAGSPLYSVTFSRSGRNDDDVLRVLRAGGNVAIVFDCEKPAKGEAFPVSHWTAPDGSTWPVLNGDADDLRFRDPAGHVVGLSFKAAKGRAKAMAEALRAGFAAAA